MVSELYSTVVQPFLQKLVDFLPQLLIAIIVFIIGYLISVGIGRLVTEILKGLKFNRLFVKEGWQKALEKADIKVDPSAFIGVIFKWIFVIVSLLLTVDILQLSKFADLLMNVLNYIPKVIVAVLIFVVAVIIADIVEKLVRAGVEKMKVGYAAVAAGIVKWTIWVFVVFMILDQLLPKSGLVQVLYTNIVQGIVLTIAGGAALAFGLGGKEAAADAIENLKRKIKQ